MNPFFGELTGLYWLWKNYSDTENIGICHYRRYFTNDNKKIMTMPEYETLLENYDVLFPMVEHELPYRDVFARAHNINDLLEVGKAIEKLYPKDVPAFEEMLNGKRASYGNLCVTKKAIFNEYCEWLFTVFSEVGEHVDLSGYDAYHKRLYGFLSESMWPVFANTRGLRTCEIKASLIAEKAEVQELKQAMAVLIAEEKLDEAKDIFVKFTEHRPDVFLDQSDIKRELPLIEVLVAALIGEGQADIKNGLYSLSHNMWELLSFLKALHKKSIAEKGGSPLSPEDEALLEKITVSKPLNMVMEQYCKAYVEAYGNPCKI